MAETQKKIVERAQKRFKQCIEWEGTARQLFKDDMKFLYADSDNQEQWNAAVRAQRQVAGQPMVTINKTHTHWLHVVNEGKENRPSIKISATGGDSTYDSAQIYQQIVRRIEYVSKAGTAYKKAMEFQVGGGIGYWRIVSKYVDEDSFDQDLFIEEVPDPLSIYMDPLIKKSDGSDARFAFVFDDMPKADAERKYGKIISRQPTFGTLAENWMKTDSVRVAEYYERNETKEWLYAIPSDDDIVVARESDLPPEMKAQVEQTEGMQKRRVSKYSVDWYLIIGNEIAEKSEWLGKYIPIIRVPGEEIVMEGRLDRKGLVRYLKDAQRSFNYNASAALEYGALQSKSPYLAPGEAIEGYENYWSSANTQNHAFLPYNHADDAGNQIPMPQRQQPPSSAPVYMEGMQAAEHELMMASGQYEATFSEQGNEISGVSIEQRQKQGARVTFHYQDAIADAIQFTGVQLIDLIPKYYDTKRILRIMDESGEEHSIMLDPNAKQALQQKDNEGEAKVAAIFNPNVGKYDVVAKAGPNFDTRREQAFDAMTQILGGNPMLANVIGDLYMGTADFPAADKLQERMRNWIKATNPAVLGDVDPQVQALQQQLQQATGMIQQLHTALNDKSVQQQMEKQRLDMEALEHLAVRMEKEREQMVDAFKAESDRLKTLAPVMSEDALDAVIRKALSEILRAPDPDLATTGVDDAASTYAAGISQVMQPVQQAEPQSTPQ